MIEWIMEKVTWTMEDILLVRMKCMKMFRVKEIKEATTIAGSYDLYIVYKTSKIHHSARVDKVTKN